MAKMALEIASTVVDAALAEGHKQGFKPLAVAVLDEGGNLVCFKKSDGCSLMRYQIATGKAWGALGMGVNSSNFVGVYEQRPHFIQSLMAASEGRFVPVPGGTLIKTPDGELIGAVGISGDTSENDEICNRAGIAAAGMTTDG